MSKSKKKEKQEESFDLNEALLEVNPLMQEGLLKFINKLDLKVESQEDFNKIFELYGGL